MTSFSHTHDSVDRLLRVAVLVDLPRSPQSGGHVKGWESRAFAVAASKMPLDLTVYFSGEPGTETLAPHVRFKQLEPVFSTKRLSFLPYVPDHTDLAPYHFALAQELRNFDVIHTTDAYFAYARTAEHVVKKCGLPLVTSFHTDTPSYARIFTANTMTGLCRKAPALSRFLVETCHLPEKQEKKMLRRLRAHLTCCCEALAIRPEDAAIVREVIGDSHLHFYRAVTDTALFNPDKADRSGIESQYGIPPGQLLTLFAGRIDIGKNVYMLVEAMERLIAQGVPVHLIAAGVGPAAQDMKDRLGDHITLPGFVEKKDLARLMASCDVFTFPSEVEIRSMVTVEALASGLPALVSEKSGIAELVPAGEAVRSLGSSPAIWAQALGNLAHNRKQITELRLVARRYADENITNWEEAMRMDFLATWQKAAKFNPRRMSAVK